MAILKEVLYDRNDLNEVLRRVDNTMSSVKSAFHEAPTRKSGNLNVTMAPGTKPGNTKGPVQLPEMQPTQLSLLSDSVMDKQALNEEDSSSEDEEEFSDRFENKVDYERFLSVLRDSLQRPNPAPSDNSAAPMTPANDSVEDAKKLQTLALNCTEEVKRTMARFNTQDEDSEEEEDDKPTRRRSA